MFLVGSSADKRDKGFRSVQYLHRCVLRSETVLCCALAMTRDRRSLAEVGPTNGRGGGSKLGGTCPPTNRIVGKFLWGSTNLR